MHKARLFLAILVVIPVGFTLLLAPRQFNPTVSPSKIAFLRPLEFSLRAPAPPRPPLSSLVSTARVVGLTATTTTRKAPRWVKRVPPEMARLPSTGCEERPYQVRRALAILPVGRVEAAIAPVPARGSPPGKSVAAWPPMRPLETVPASIPVAARNEKDVAARPPAPIML